MKTFISWLLIVCLVPLLTGCQSLKDESLTARLWDSDLVSDHRGPTPYPDLKLYQTADRKDVLVQYNEERDRDATIRRRAYLLYANQPRIEVGKKPKFVNIHQADKLQPIPVETNGPAELVPAINPPLRALLQADQRHFILIANGSETGSFNLPVYVDAESQAELITLTPLAVVGDVAMCTVVVAVVAAVIYAGGQIDTSRP